MVVAVGFEPTLQGLGGGAGEPHEHTQMEEAGGQRSQYL